MCKSVLMAIVKLG